MDQGCIILESLLGNNLGRHMQLVLVNTQTLRYPIYKHDDILFTVFFIRNASITKLAVTDSSGFALFFSSRIIFHILLYKTLWMRMHD